MQICSIRDGALGLGRGRFVTLSHKCIKRLEYCAFRQAQRGVAGWVVGGFLCATSLQRGADRLKTPPNGTAVDAQNEGRQEAPELVFGLVEGVG